jgi:hypothetical protein
MSSLQDAYDQAERGVERAEQFKPIESDPLRVGRVELWKPITPKLRPDEPVWLVEACDRDGRLWSKFISEAALQSKLLGRRFNGPSEVTAADPAEFRAQVGDVIAIKWLGKHPHPEDPGKSVTRWTVSIIKADDASTADRDIPF